MTETKTKKAPLSRLACALLALVMAIGICVPTMAFAADDYTITVNPAYSGETYTAYKIFDVTYNEEGSAYSYTIDGDSAWYSTVANAKVNEENVFTLTQISGTNTYVVTFDDELDAATIASIFTTVPNGAVVAATAKAEEVVDSETGATGTTSVTLNVTTSGAGYYFITTSVGSVVSIDTTHPTVTVEDKNPVPTLTKEVENVSHDGTLEENGDKTEGTEDTASVGDILEFEIDITNAAHKSALCLHDYTTEGLTYYGSEHINIYVNSISDATKIVAENNYTIKDSECDDGCDFEIEFTESFLASLNDDDKIIVTYEAVVNEAAVVVNGNDAFLTYGVGGRSVVVETETDVYGFDLVKTDSSENELEGATFTLADSEGNPISFVVDGTTYTVHDATEDPENTEGATTEIKVGKATIFGLDVGAYTLKETEAPAGYNQLTYDIIVTIADDGSVSISAGDNSSITDGTITVVNNTGTKLPGTGGMGTTIFYIIGGILVVGAIVLLITRRRMNNRA